MPPGAYTSLSTIRPAYCEEMPAQYAVTASPPFADGGRDFNLDADQAIRTWAIDYAVLTTAEAATLDAHVAAAKFSPDVGSAYSFNFTDRDGVTHPNVRYDRGGYERSHTKTWIHARRVRLIKYP